MKVFDLDAVIGFIRLLRQGIKVHFKNERKGFQCGFWEIQAGHRYYYGGRGTSRYHAFKDAFAARQSEQPYAEDLLYSWGGAQLLQWENKNEGL